MKFRCERDVLSEAVGTSARATSSRGGSLPVLSGLRVHLAGDRLTVTGSDLDLTISVEEVVAGEDDGTAVIPAKLFADILRALEPGAVFVETTGEEVLISSGRSQFAVHLIPAEEFPHVPEASADSVTLSASRLAEGLKQVVPAASADDNRVILTGVLMAAEGDGLRLVATDSYRLAIRDLPGQRLLGEEQAVLVPSRALGELVKTLSAAEEVTLVVGEQDATFKLGNVRLTTRLISGDFPNYRGLIPTQQPNRLVASRATLLEAVKRVKLMARESTPVRMSFSEGSVELIAVTQDVGQAHEEIDADYTGDELTVAFNPDFLIHGLEVAAGDEVALETIDALKPALLKSTTSSEFLYLLMPVRVS